jgi:PKD repeat protein
MAILQAEFNVAQRSGIRPYAAQFNDLSQGSVTGYSWDFGDGGFSTVQNPVHTYTAKGTYTVSLQVSDGTTSNTLGKIDYINVGDPEAEKHYSLNGPVKVKMTYDGHRGVINYSDGTWQLASRRDMDSTSPWKITFFMKSDSSAAHNCVLGKGFVSKLAVVADEITGNIDAKEYGVSTERRNLIFYKDASGEVT